MRWLRRAVSVAAATWLAAVPSSFAQGEGVTIDPDSPSGKEYQLPLESARRQADPNGVRKGRVVQGSRTSPLFGEGIVAPREGAAGQSAGSAKSGAKGQASSAAESKDGGNRTAPLPASVAATRPGAPDGGIGTSVLVLGISVLVMGVGLLSGLLLRRRSRSA